MNWDIEMGYLVASHGSGQKPKATMSLDARFLEVDSQDDNNGRRFTTRKPAWKLFIDKYSPESYLSSSADIVGFYGLADKRPSIS